MSVIRVALVVRPAAGGIRRHVSSLLARLRRSEFAPTLFAPPDFQLDPPTDAVPRVAIRIEAKTSPFQDLRAILQLSTRLRGQFDLVHAHGIRGALVAVPAARLAKVPALFTAHNLVPPSGRVTSAVLKFLGRNASVIAVSNAAADTLTAHGIDRRVITVIPNGIDISAFDRPRLEHGEKQRILAKIVGNAVWSSQDSEFNSPTLADRSDKPKFIVAAIGRISPEKGFDLLISAFAQWNAHPQAMAPDFVPRLIIAGSGSEEARLIALARDAPGVTFAGAMRDVSPLLQIADVVAIPSREEGQGIVALEAMAARKPVVAAAVGGLPESILDGETGLLVSPEDPAAFLEAFRRLAQSPNLCADMGSRGRERVERRFTLDRMMDRITAHYRETSGLG